jgi:hypothetical protein
LRGGLEAPRRGTRTPVSLYYFTTMNDQYLVISYVDTFPIENFEGFKTDVEVLGLKVFLEARPASILAGLEWLMPTAIVFFITKAYFESFLKEMGKDHYFLLKKGLQNLSSKVLVKQAVKTQIFHTKNKIDPQKKYSHVFSIVAEVEPGLRVKLLFDGSLSEDDCVNQVEEFLNWLAHLQAGTTSFSELQKFVPTRIISDTILVVFNKENKRLEFLDPIPENIALK